MSRKASYLIEPEVIRQKEFLKLGEELPVVEAIDCFHVTGAVIQTTSDLRWEINRYANKLLHLIPNQFHYTSKQYQASLKCYCLLINILLFTTAM